MNKKDPKETVTKPKRMRQPTDRTLSGSGRADIRVGMPLPLGTSVSNGGVNFALFSRHASRVHLDLFDYPEDA